MAFPSFLTRKRVVLVLLGGLACLAVLAVLLAAVDGPAYEVRGNADVPYPAGPVKEVRVLDSLTVYVDGEPKPGQTVVGGIALIVLATAAFMTAAALHIAARRGRLIAFYLLISAGLGYAGVDELFALHETIGHNLRFLADVPGVSRPDDLVVASYVIPAAAFAYFFRDILLGSAQSGRGARGRPGLLRAGRGRGPRRQDHRRGVHGAVQRPLHRPWPGAPDVHAPAPQPAPGRRGVPDEVTVVDQRTRSRPPVGAAH